MNAIPGWDRNSRKSSNSLEERLCRGREGLAGLGRQHEGPLNGVAAVQNGFLRAGHAADRHGLDGALTLHGGEGGAADGFGVASHRLDDAAGGGQLLIQLAGVLGAGDGLKAVSGAAARLMADAGDGTGVTAYLAPVGDLTGEDLADLLHGEIRHLAVGAAIAGGLNARAGAGGVVGDGDAAVVRHELLAEGADDLLHRGGAVGGHAAGEGGGGLCLCAAAGVGVSGCFRLGAAAGEGRKAQGQGQKQRKCLFHIRLPRLSDIWDIPL